MDESMEEVAGKKTHVYFLHDLIFIE
jgi:hypothetical protein